LTTDSPALRATAAGLENSGLPLSVRPAVTVTTVLLERHREKVVPYERRPFAGPQGARDHHSAGPTQSPRTVSSSGVEPFPACRGA
jgi:hypothetical protein